ncbi:hypothetical protein [Caldivirga sp. UBA161]|uniref:hypothetical protein n=1 Tax=Caldivirga sp. UBA161 TaxID=1915569 RepID=UPI0025BE24AB|nr:hypothetical protein [Caldivirga sp. UBA161]
MSQQYSSQMSARLAMLLLRELAYKGGKAKLRYLKVYRTILEWGGGNYAAYILSRLKDGSLIRIEGNYIVLTTNIQPSNPTRLEREAREMLIKGV